jgi:hypothetical protein
VDIDTLPQGEDFTSDTQIVRWATDPAGRVCQIGAEIPDPPDWPVFTPDADDGPVLRLFLWIANRVLRRGYERGERRQSGPSIWYLEVWRFDEADRTLLVEEELADPQETRLRVDELTEQVAGGVVEERD